MGRRRRSLVSPSPVPGTSASEPSASSDSNGEVPPLDIPPLDALEDLMADATAEEAAERPPESVTSEPVFTPPEPLAEVMAPGDVLPAAPTEVASPPASDSLSGGPPLDEPPDFLADLPPPPPDLSGQDVEDMFGGPPPPTEELQVMEDLSQVYSEPMHVPDAPPIPEILDRYDAASPPEDPEYVVTSREPAIASVSTVEESWTPSAEPESEPAPLPVGRLLAVVMVIVLLGGGAALLVLLDGSFLAPDDAALTVFDPTMAPLAPVVERPQPEPRTEVSSVVESSRKAEPGVDLPPALEELPYDSDGADESETLAASDEAVSEEPPEGPVEESTGDEPSTSAGVATAEPAPVVAPQRRRSLPEVGPLLTRKGDSEGLGTLKIRVTGSQRIMLKVDGKPIGTAPRDQELPPGTYTISASPLGGGGNTQEQSVTVGIGETQPVQFEF